MKMQAKINLQFFVMALVLFLGISTVQATPCVNNNWQPTFVHDLDNEDGPWYVTPGGQFTKLRILDNQSWIQHACDLINQRGVRDRRGFTNCQQYTRVQCGCMRGLSEPNSTCARFLAFHNNRIPTLPYQQTNNNPDVLVSPNPIMRDGIVARVEQRDKCIYRSGGRPKTRSNYYCKIRYSLLNTTDEDIRMTSGGSKIMNIVTGKLERHGLHYRTIKPGEKFNGHNICIIPHNKTVGTLKMWGTGHHRNNPDREQFQWQLEIQCRL